MQNRHLMVSLFAVLLLAIGLRFAFLLTPLSGMMVERQADTATIAHNLVVEEFNPIHPKIDWRGTSPGYVEAEFQLYTTLVAMISLVTSLQLETVGRLVSVISSLLCLVYFYWLVKSIANGQTAAIGTVILACFPVYLYFSRLFMPESLLLALTIMCIFYFMSWIENPVPRLLLVWVGLLSLVILIKPYMAHLMIPLAALSWKNQRIRSLIHIRSILVLGLASASIILFIYHSHSLYRMTGLTFGIFDAGQGKWLNPTYYSYVSLQKLLVTRLFLQHFNWALLTALLGFAITWNKEGSTLFRWWILSISIYFLIVNQGNFVHIHYQLPAVFAVAYFSAEGFYWLLRAEHRWMRVASQVLFLSFIGTSFFVASLFFLTEQLPSTSIMKLFPSQFRTFASIDPEIFSASELSQVSRAIEKCTAPTDLLIVAGKTSPVIFYVAERKGWKQPIESLSDSVLAERRSQGASHLVVNTRTRDAAIAWSSVRLRLQSAFHVTDTLGVSIYKLQ